MPRAKKIKEEEGDLDKKYFDIISPKSEEELAQDIMDTPKKQEEEVLSIRKESFEKKERVEETEEEDYEKADDEIEPVTYRERFETKETPDIAVEAGTKFETEDEVETIYEETKKKKKFHFKMKNKVLVVSIACFVLVGTVFGLYSFVFDKANIIVTTRKSTIKYEGVVLADINAKEIDPNKGIIPGRLLTVSKSLEKEYTATGKVSGGAKAHGTMLIYNAYSQSPQVLVTGTRFESTDGLIFKLNARTVVPGATLKNGDLEPVFIEAEVTAAETGTAYNIAPGRFTIPGFKGGDKYKGFYGETKVAMVGGSEGESIVVSSGDIKAAEISIGDDLIKLLESELAKQIKDTDRTFKEAIVTKVNKRIVQAEVGDSMTKFKVSVSGEIKTIVVAKNDLDELVKTNLASSLTPADQLYGVPEYIFSNLKFDAQKGNISFYTTCNYPAQKNLDKEEILEIVKGKTIEEVKKALLNNEKIENTQIKLSPFWLNSIPVEKGKIVLTLD